MRANGDPEIPALEAKTADEGTASRWNTKNLALRLGVDMVSASCAAGLIAPLISILDR